MFGNLWARVVDWYDRLPLNFLGLMPKGDLLVAEFVRRSASDLSFTDGERRAALGRMRAAQWDAHGLKPGIPRWWKAAGIDHFQSHLNDLAQGAFLFEVGQRVHVQDLKGAFCGTVRARWIDENTAGACYAVTWNGPADLALCYKQGTLSAGWPEEWTVKDIP